VAVSAVVGEGLVVDGEVSVADRRMGSSSSSSSSSSTVGPTRIRERETRDGKEERVEGRTSSGCAYVGSSCKRLAAWRTYDRLGTAWSATARSARVEASKE